MSCCTSRASSSPTCSTRTARTRCGGSRPRSARCGCRSTTCCRAATSPSRASTATCSRPTACSPTTAAGCGGWRRRSRNGLTAEAAVEKVQSDMRARMLHMTDPYLRERMSDFDDLANRLLRQLMGAVAGRCRGELLPKDAIIVARSMGAAELLDYPRDKLRGLVLEEGAVDQPRRHRRARHGHSGRRPGRRAPFRMSENGDADHRRRRRRRGASAAAAGSRSRLCGKGAVPGAAAGALPRAAQASRRSRKDGVQRRRC